MIPVLMAVSFLTVPEMVFGGCLFGLGLLLGLRVNAKRLASLREQLRLANQLHSAYITSAHNEDLAEVGPATGDHRAVDLFDQDADLNGRAVMRGLSIYDEDTGEQLAGPEIDCPEEGSCRRPEQCETGCYWLRLGELNRPLIEDEDSGPRSIPGRID